VRKNDLNLLDSSEVTIKLLKQFLVKINKQQSEQKSFKKLQLYLAYYFFYSTPVNVNLDLLNF